MGHESVRGSAVRHEPRAEGTSGYTFRKLFIHTMNMMTGFSTMPLQIASLVGFAFTLFGFGVLCYVVIRYFLQGAPGPGVPLPGIDYCPLLRSTIVCPWNYGRISGSNALPQHAETTLRCAWERGQHGQERSMSFSIPFNRPCLSGNKYKYIAQAIANGHASGDGAFTRLCHEFLERELQVPKVLLTTSCTHALEMAAILLDCGPGSEVILPSFTFVSTANAFVLRGARVVFADVRADTMNLDEARLEPADYVADEGDRARALCGRSLRNGYDLRDRRTPRNRGGGRQCPRPLRAL